MQVQAMLPHALPPTSAALRCLSEEQADTREAAAAAAASAAAAAAVAAAAVTAAAADAPHADVLATGGVKSAMQGRAEDNAAMQGWAEDNAAMKGLAEDNAAMQGWAGDNAAMQGQAEDSVAMQGWAEGTASAAACPSTSSQPGGGAPTAARAPRGDAAPGPSDLTGTAAGGAVGQICASHTDLEQEPLPPALPPPRPPPPPLALPQPPPQAPLRPQPMPPAWEDLKLDIDSVTKKDAALAKYRAEVARLVAMVRLRHVHMCLSVPTYLLHACLRACLPACVHALLVCLHVHARMCSCLPA
eukprot:364044-Chlamydomonas_euryale.AAC.3